MTPQSAEPPTNPHPLARVLSAAAVLLALAYVLWPLREAYRGVDLRYLYAAGKAWFAGQSPYDYYAWHAHFEFSDPPFSIHRSAAPFIYPPHWAPIATALAILPYSAAIHLWDVTNVSAYLATLALSLHLVSNAHPLRWTGPAALIAITAATANGAVRFALWEPQMGFLPVLAIVGAFYSWRSKRVVALAICTFFMLLKPQLSLIPLAFIAISGGHAGVSLGLVLTAGVSFAALLPVVTPNALYAQLLDCSARHRGDLYNVPSNFTHLNSWILQVTGVAGLSWCQLPAAAAGILWLRKWYAYQTRPQDAVLKCLAICCAATPVFVPIHQYDLILYTPLLIIVAFTTSHWMKFAALALSIQLAGRAHALPGALLALGALLTLAIAAIALFTGHSKTLAR